MPHRSPWHGYRPSRSTSDGCLRCIRHAAWNTCPSTAHLRATLCFAELFELAELAAQLLQDALLDLCANEDAQGAHRESPGNVGVFDDAHAARDLLNAILHVQHIDAAAQMKGDRAQRLEARDCPVHLHRAAALLHDLAEGTADHAGSLLQHLRLRDAAHPGHGLFRACEPAEDDFGAALDINGRGDLHRSVLPFAALYPRTNGGPCH